MIASLDEYDNIIKIGGSIEPPIFCFGAFKAWKQPPVLLGVEEHFSLRIKTSMV